MKNLVKNSNSNSKTKALFWAKKAALSLSTVLVMLATGNQAIANIGLKTDSGWETTISGSIPVFVVSSVHDKDETAFRIQSGFNPANLNFYVNAPKMENGLTVSGHFQINTHLNAPKGVQNGGLFESRIANIQLSGHWGTFTLGKDFGVFNSNAIGDIASQGGVGWLGGGADTGNATGGRIGTGYVYANFNPQVKFTSKNIGGLVIKLALINPEEPNDEDIETDSPRIEGQITYHTDGLKLWVGVLQQNVTVLGINAFNYDMQGFDVGTHLDLGSFGLTLAYTDTTGIGADGLYGGTINDADVDATQWYIEVDYKIDKTRIGISYGEGHQDNRKNDSLKGLTTVTEITNELSMLFVHYQMSPAFRLIGEVQNYQSDVQNNYQALVLGFQYDF
ncbi:MAG: porin [Colwellia sp.]|nr:porin [Colwellia sp.]